MLKLKPLPFIILLLSGTTASGWAAQLTQPLNLKAVTVYLHGASLQSEEAFDLPAGESEMTFTNVADFVLPDSVAVAMDNGVTVLSSSVIKQNVLQPKADMQQQIKRAEQEKAKLIADKKNIDSQLKVLEANRSLTTKSAAEVGKYLQMVKEKNGELLQTASRLEQEIADKEQELANIAQGGGSAGGEYKNQIVARIYTPKAIHTKAVVHYMTPLAGWTPLYDIHASEINQPLRLVYKASIRQNTGLAWKNVNIALSTSEPDTHLSLPKLDPQYVDVNGYMLSGSASIVRSRSGSSGMMDDGDIEAQKAQIEEAAKAKKSFAQQAAAPARIRQSESPLSVINVYYTLSLPWQIDSDNIARTVVIKEQPVSGQYRFIAIPKLSNDVYLQVQIKEWEQLNVIPGESQIFFGNNRTGVGYLQPPEDGKTLDVQLNRDPRIIIQRKAVLKKENAVSIFNDSAVRNFSYTLNVKNSYPGAIDLTLIDQIPVSANGDITVEKMQYGQGQFNAKTGELVWEMRMAGKENVSLPFSYSVKYPKNKEPAGL